MVRAGQGTGGLNKTKQALPRVSVTAVLYIRDVGYAFLSHSLRVCVYDFYCVPVVPFAPSGSFGRYRTNETVWRQAVGAGECRSGGGGTDRPTVT